MGTAPAPTESPQHAKRSAPKPRKKKRRSWLRRILGTFLVLAVILGAARLALPSVLQWYVNRTIDQNPLYDGKIGDIDVHLWRGAYSIEDIRLLKTTGNVPVPLFAAKRVDLALEWGALLHGAVVGRIAMEQPELNFVDGEEEGEDQTGAGGPWLKIIDELFPFRINSAVVHDGSVHFRAFATDPPLDVALTQVEAELTNLGNITDDIVPLNATVEATALAMDHAPVELEVKLDPSSYRPTFELALRLLRLEVVQTNDLVRAYGGFEFESGWFDLVVELEANEGRLEGYVKPLYRNLQVLNLNKDLAEANILQVFWEALVGGVSELLENQPRNQFATVIPVTGVFDSPDVDVLSTIFNVLRNAFIRAYLPRLQGVTEETGGLQFGKGSVTDPPAVGSEP